MNDREKQRRSNMVAYQMKLHKEIVDNGYAKYTRMIHIGMYNFSYIRRTAKEMLDAIIDIHGYRVVGEDILPAEKNNRNEDGDSINAHSNNPEEELAEADEFIDNLDKLEVEEK